jgi:hypothetical protein
MRIDRPKPEPRPKALPWDTQGLRDRLEGQEIDEGSHIDALHALARERDADGEKRKRSRLLRRR